MGFAEEPITFAANGEERRALVRVVGGHRPR